MQEYLALASCLCFIAFLVPTPYRKYCAAAGWAGITVTLCAGLPYYFSANNFMYPAIAVLSVPFLWITLRCLQRGDASVLQMSRGAGVAALIYAPFAYIPALGDLLISVVISQTHWVLSLLNFPATLAAWNIIAYNGFQVEIILACTGIQSIAIMLGVAGAVPTDLKQKISAFLIVVPTIYLLNILRNAFVIMAYMDQWFPYLPEIVGNGSVGYESFFWVHNVICELLALLILMGIAYALFLAIPQIGEFAVGICRTYRAEIMRIAGRDSRLSE